MAVGERSAIIQWGVKPCLSEKMRSVVLEFSICICMMGYGVRGDEPGEPKYIGEGVIERCTRYKHHGR